MGGDHTYGGLIVKGESAKNLRIRLDLDLSLSQVRGSRGFCPGLQAFWEGLREAHPYHRT
jgi:hypothetical protein